MKRIALIIILILSFSSCKSSKRRTSSTKVITKKNEKEVSHYKNETPETGSKTETSTISKTKSIIDYAIRFKGVRYKWGGTTKKGMDCSGLVYESFKEHDIVLPRISRDMAKKGNKVSLKKVHKGDLLFFKTKNRRNAINHVGLVVDIKGNDIKFIHATSSKGVIVSGLNETYWLKSFYQARRVL